MSSRSIQPIKEICQKVRSAKRSSSSPRVLLHTDAAQAIGKIKVDAQELGVDYMTVVGHKVTNGNCQGLKLQSL